MAETVKVVRDGPRGWHLINKQDFDPVRHVLWESEEDIAARKEAEKKAAKEAEKEAKSAAAEAAKKAAEEAAKLNQPAQDK